MYAEIYKLSDFTTSNGVVNYESLKIEILASSVDGVLSVDGIKGAVYVQLAERLKPNKKNVLDALIENHDGLPARTTVALQDKRSDILNRLVQMAHFHPVLKNTPNDITGYLTSIDNWLNAWRRDGNATILIGKIVEDANDENNPYHGYLNTVVNFSGAKTYEFLISGIPTNPFLQ